MKTLVPVVAVVACAAAFIARPAQAAVPEETQVHVPFSFVIGDEQLPAGTYMVTTDEYTPSVVIFRGEVGVHTAIVDTEWGSSRIADTPGLRFAVYGTTHFLSGVRMADESMRMVSVTPDDVATELVRLDRHRYLANGE